MRFESLSLGCLWCSESLGLILGRLFPFFFRPAKPPAQCRARVRVKRRYLRRRTIAFSSLFNFALPTPSLAQSRGATRVPRSRVTWYRAMYGPVCYLLLLFVCYICSTLFFRLKNSRVFAVSSSNPPPCRWPAGGFWHDFSLVLAPAFPSISTRARLTIVPFLWLVCRRASPAPPPATLAVCGRF